MPQAKIRINGVDGSNDDLPIGTLVALSNHNVGGEISYLWGISYQAPGTADVLSSTTSATPTFTPRKEGTYRITLIVNNALVTEARDSVIVGVRQLKTGKRVPAADETNENSVTAGWADAAGDVLRLMDSALAKPTWCAAVADVSVTGAGQVVALNGAVVIKNGLPGQETLPNATAANPASAALPGQRVGLVIATVRGGPFTSGTLVWVLMLGVYPATLTLTSAVAPQPGDGVYLGATGVATLTAGGKRIGYVLTATLVSGSTYHVTAFVDASVIENPPVHQDFLARRGLGGGAISVTTTGDTAFAPDVIDYDSLAIYDDTNGHFTYEAKARAQIEAGAEILNVDAGDSAQFVVQKFNGSTWDDIAVDPLQATISKSGTTNVIDLKMRRIVNVVASGVYRIIVRAFGLGSSSGWSISAVDTAAVGFLGAYIQTQQLPQ